MSDCELKKEKLTLDNMTAKMAFKSSIYRLSGDAEKKSDWARYCQWTQRSVVELQHKRCVHCRIKSTENNFEKRCVDLEKRIDAIEKRSVFEVLMKGF